MTPWTVACPGFSVHGIFQQEYWSGLPFSSPGNLPNPGIGLASFSSPALAGGFFTTIAIWEARYLAYRMSELENTQRESRPWSFMVSSCVRASCKQGLPLISYCDPGTHTEYAVSAVLLFGEWTVKADLHGASPGYRKHLLLPFLIQWLH